MMRLLVLAGVVSLVSAPVFAGEYSNESQFAAAAIEANSGLNAACCVEEKLASSGMLAGQSNGQALAAYLAQRDAWQTNDNAVALKAYLAQRDAWDTKAQAISQLALKDYLGQRDAWQAHKPDSLKAYLAQRDTWNSQRALEVYLAQRDAHRAQQTLQQYLAQRKAWQAQAALAALLAQRDAWQAEARVQSALNQYLARRAKWANLAGPAQRDYAVRLLRPKRVTFRVSRAAIRTTLGSF